MAKHKDSNLSKMHQRVILATKAKDSLNANTFWDDCNNHYKVATEAIHQVEGQLAQQLELIVNTPELVGQIEDQQNLAENLAILHKDITEHVDRLNNIYENHKDKSGGIVNPEEGLEVIQINGKYQEAMEIYNANVMPTLCHIFEQITPAQKMMSQMLEDKKVQEGLLDPSIISDAVVKGE